MPLKPRTKSKALVKAKSDTSKTVSQTPLETPTASGLSQEAEDQFELELCWCIQQLEATLISGKLQEKQAYNLGKSLNTLKSNTAPLIKKRQIMTNTLGNYREKMAKDKQKLARASASVKFTTVTPNKKSVFLKKAQGHSIAQTDSVKREIENGDIQQPFKFNFQLQE